MVLKIVVTILAIILSLAGVAGSVLPVLPGIPLIFIGVFIYALVDGFHQVSLLMVLIYGLLAVLALGLDYLAQAYGAKRFGASKWGIVGAIVGVLLGFTFGLIGIIVLPFVGALIGELLTGKTHRQAIKAGLGSVIGFLGGAWLKFVLGLVMAIVFIIKIL